MSDKMTKIVSLASILEDLASGVSKWKKDDIGFGSLEKKYNLTLAEASELFSHPKIKNVDSKIPTFVIIDDLPETESQPQVVAPVVTETRIEVEQPRPQPVTVQKAKVVVKAEPVYEEEPQLTPFI